MLFVNSVSYLIETWQKLIDIQGSYYAAICVDMCNTLSIKKGTPLYFFKMGAFVSLSEEK